MQATIWLSVDCWQCWLFVANIPTIHCWATDKVIQTAPRLIWWRNWLRMNLKWWHGPEPDPEIWWHGLEPDPEKWWHGLEPDPEKWWHGLEPDPEDPLYWNLTLNTYLLKQTQIQHAKTVIEYCVECIKSTALCCCFFLSFRWNIFVPQSVPSGTMPWVCIPDRKFNLGKFWTCPVLLGVKGVLGVLLRVL